MQSEKTLIQKIIDKNIKFKNSGNRFHELDLGEEAPCGGRSSFYDDVKVVDKRNYGQVGEFNEEAERKRIREFLKKPYQDDWDD